MLEGGTRTAKSGRNIRIPASMRYEEWRASLESYKIQTGALNPHSVQAEEHAERYYGLVRSMKTDCTRIAQNTGFREEDIRRIKNHVFFSVHELYDGVRRFDADYEMAQSWQRLIEGKNIQVRDLVLLNHEFLESVLEAQGLKYHDAHDLTEPIYNYAAELRKAGR